MRDQTTFFSSFVRVVKKLQLRVEKVEYCFETSITPVRRNNKLYAEKNYKLFARNILKEAVYFLSRKKTSRHIIKPFSVSKNSKPKVVHFMTYGVVGGGAKLVFDIINRLGEYYDMELILLSDLQLDDYPNLKLHCFNNPQLSKKYIEQLAPDIIHTYYYGDWGGFHSHFSGLLQAKGTSKIIENLLVPIHIYRSERVDEYVYITKYIQGLQFKEQANERVIYPGVDLEEFKPKDNKKWNNAVGMVYRLWNDKIDQSTVEMFIQLVKECPRTLVYIVGGGENFHHYVERTRMENVRQNFYFTGLIDYKQVNSYYDKFDIFVAPVHTESYGYVVPNAMAKNMPVVAYRRGALPELLGNTNILVNTAPEMIAAIKYLLQHPGKARQIAKNGRERVSKLFNINIMAEQYNDLYQDLLTRKIE